MQQQPNGGAPSSAAPAVWPPAFQPGPLPHQSFPSLAAAACSAGMPPAGPAWGSTAPVSRGGHGVPIPWPAPFGQPGATPGFGQVPGLPVPGFPVAPHWPGQSFLPPVQQPAGSQQHMIGTLPTSAIQPVLLANGPAVSPFSLLSQVRTRHRYCNNSMLFLGTGCIVFSGAEIGLLTGAGEPGSVYAAECSSAEPCRPLCSSTVSGISSKPLDHLNLLLNQFSPCLASLSDTPQGIACQPRLQNNVVPEMICAVHTDWSNHSSRCDRAVCITET